MIQKANSKQRKLFQKLRSETMKNKRNGLKIDPNVLIWLCMIVGLCCLVIQLLLSEFTSDYSSLLLGVNIGGTGTLIASLASLITFREYTSHNPEKTKSYLFQFTAYSFGFVIVLTAISMLTL